MRGEMGGAAPLLVVVCVAGVVIGGRREDAPLEEQVAAALADSVRRELRTRLAGLTCAVHGEAPVVRAEGPTFTRLQYTVTGCCAALVTTAQQRLPDDRG
jgi:hypothetical protein